MIKCECHLAGAEVLFLGNTPQVNGRDIFARFVYSGVDGVQTASRIDCQLFTIGASGRPPIEDCKLEL